MASLSEVFPMGAGVHLAIPLSHLYAILVGTGADSLVQRDLGCDGGHPSAAAPIASRHADLLADVVWSSSDLASSVADLASDEAQYALFALAA